MTRIALLTLSFITCRGSYRVRIHFEVSQLVRNHRRDGKKHTVLLRAFDGMHPRPRTVRGPAHALGQALVHAHSISEVSDAATLRERRRCASSGPLHAQILPRRTVAASAAVRHAIAAVVRRLFRSEGAEVAALGVVRAHSTVVDPAVDAVHVGQLRLGRGRLDRRPHGHDGEKDASKIDNDPGDVDQAKPRLFRNGRVRIGAATAAAATFHVLPPELEQHPEGSEGEMIQHAMVRRVGIERLNVDNFPVRVARTLALAF